MKLDKALEIVRNMREWPDGRRFVPDNPMGGGPLKERLCALCGEPFLSIFIKARYHPACADAVRRQRERMDKSRVQRAREFHEKRRILAAAMEQILEQQGISVKDFLENRDATPALQRKPLGETESLAPGEPGRENKRGTRRNAKEPHNGRHRSSVR